MYLHFDIGIDYLLFSFWKPENACQTFFSCLAICTLGVTYEVLKYAQKVVHLKQTENENYGQMNYNSMLIAMTFQVYFLLAVIFGAALGYFLFEPLRARKQVVSMASRYTAI